MADGRTAANGRARRSRAGATPRARAGGVPPAVLDALRAMAEGRYDEARVAARPAGAGGALADAVNAAAERARSDLALAHAHAQAVREGVSEAIDALVRTVVQGDLTGEVRLGVSDASLTPLVASVGQIMETLRRFVAEMRDAALHVASASTQVLQAATDSERSTAQQASAIHETTATMEELKGASQQIAENAQMVATTADGTLASTRQGESSLQALMDSMGRVRQNAVDVDDAISKLSRRVERIGTVVEVIDEIADRSDLLALNAALEGAKAGEAGRGFSIVAAEMRRLAENVLESTKEIKNLIAEIREATHAAKDASDGNKRVAGEGERLGRAAMQNVAAILQGIQETSDAARVIHLATQQQRTATEQVVQSMTEIEDVTRQAQAGSKGATAAASELAQLAERLSQLVKRFRVA